jgi:pyruvate/2-oxoglutarate dehydrogenase complex dihydrolipoamide dehydrogenase (E3) component
MSLLKPDICVVGASSGGLSVAVAAAAFGVPVVLVEKGDMDVGCPKGGRSPAMALMASAARAAAMRDAGPLGLSPVEPQVNPAGVHAHVSRTVATLALNDSASRLAALGVQLIRSDARFIDRRTLEAGGQLIQARRFVVEAGSAPLVPVIPGLGDVPFLTSETVSGLTRRPEHLIIIGGGATGVELAQAHLRLGARVTLIEDATILAKEDAEGAGFVRRALMSEGATILEGRKVLQVARSGKAGIRLLLAGASGETTIDGSHLLVLGGRQPILAGLGLDAARIACDAKGIIVDRGLRSSNRRVYAIGECVGGAAGSAHDTDVAHDHAGLVIRSALFRQRARIEKMTQPRVVFTAPELASVGLSETEARASFRGVQTLRWPFAENQRAQATGETGGMIKIVADAKGRILGAVIVGAQAGELITPWTLAIGKGLKLADMAATVIPGSTLSDVSRQVSVSSLAPLTTSPSVRRLIRFLRIFG